MNSLSRKIKTKKFPKGREKKIVLFVLSSLSSTILFLDLQIYSHSFLASSSVVTRSPSKKYIRKDPNFCASTHVFRSSPTSRDPIFTTSVRSVLLLALAFPPKIRSLWLLDGAGIINVVPFRRRNPEAQQRPCIAAPGGGHQRQLQLLRHGLRQGKRP